MRSRIVVLLLGLALLAAACGESIDGAGGAPAPAIGSGEAGYGPFLADDPFDAIASLEWREMSAALPDGPIRNGGPVAVLLDDSTEQLLHIAVNGGGCRPELRIAVVQPPPELELGISVGDYISPPGLECTDILTTHGFEVRLNDPVSLDAVVLNPMLSERGEDVVIVVPGAEGTLPGDVWLRCPSGPSFPAAALDYLKYQAGNADFDPLDTDPPGIREAMDEFLSDAEGQYWPQEGWRLLHVTETEALVVARDTENSGIAFIELELDGMKWRWAGASAGGPCPLQIQLPDGLGVVTWRVDPDGGPLGIETTSIDVLATERNCASGQPMGDRLIGPEVLLTDEEVLIVFGVEPLGGAQDCQGNPEQPVTVELPEPLGDRVVRDGVDTGLSLGDFLN
ncbi:MAG: hypothetical protein QNJ75_11960 [Acidimicrobiia bacterium]|nr:hypothetical protein [Acidimicrobiia bacterium]MDJ0665268.1 hypothetical protein [Acidimicrobiia bacterium]